MLDKIISFFTGRAYPEIETITHEGLRTERDYQLHCNEILQGKVEHRLPDGTRVDILTDCLAIEVDFAKKWYEAVGQAAHYSRMTKRPPGVLLIVKERGDEKYVSAAKDAVNYIKVKIEEDYFPITLLIYRNY